MPSNDETIYLSVFGKPAGSGSKTAFRTPKGRMIVAPASKYQKPWQEAVKWSFLQSEYAQMIPLTCPLAVDIIFTFVRSKTHFGTGKNAKKLKMSAPAYPAKRPDIEKIARSTNDALTGLVWADDSQIVQLTLQKIYGDRSSARIEIKKREAQNG